MCEAETSVTIPGIEYVVDCGRVKTRTFHDASGISRYEGMEGREGGREGGGEGGREDDVSRN